MTAVAAAAAAAACSAALPGLAAAAAAPRHSRAAWRSASRRGSEQRLRAARKRPMICAVTASWSAGVDDARRAAAPSGWPPGCPASGRRSGSRWCAGSGSKTTRVRVVRRIVVRRRRHGRSGPEAHRDRRRAIGRPVTGAERLGNGLSAAPHVLAEQVVVGAVDGAQAPGEVVGRDRPADRPGPIQGRRSTPGDAACASAILICCRMNSRSDLI